MADENRNRYIGFLIGASLIFVLFLGISVYKIYEKIIFNNHGVKSMGLIISKDTLEINSYTYIISYVVNEKSMRKVLHADYNFGSPGDSTSVYYLKEDESNVVFARDLVWNSSLVGMLVCTVILGITVALTILRPNFILKYVNGEIW